MREAASVLAQALNVRPNELRISRRERVVSRSKIAGISRAKRSAGCACWADWLMRSRFIVLSDAAYPLNSAYHSADGIPSIRSRFRANNQSHTFAKVKVRMIDWTIRRLRLAAAAPIL